MLARLRADLKQDPNKRAILIAGALLILAAALAATFAHVTRNLSGEAFYDFQFPYRLPFAQAWKVFFLERIRSRLMHGVFISAIYSVVGFNPRVIYFVLYVFVILTAVTIALNLRHFVSQPWQAALLAALLALLPVALPELVEVKKAHHVFAWFAFWIAVSFIRAWLKNEKRRWLLAGALAFLASVLAYEATIALLPIALFLSAGCIKNIRDALRRFGPIFFISICAALAFLRLEDLKPYTGIQQTYPGFSSPPAVTTNVTQAVPSLLSAIGRGDLVGEASLPWMRASGVVLLVASFSLAAFGVYKSLSRQAKWSRWQHPVIALTAAALYLTLFTYLPFMLAGQAPDSDSLRGAALGFVLLVVAAAHVLSEWGKPRSGNMLFAITAGLLLGAGLFGYRAADRVSLADDAKLARFIFTLRQQIPGVRGGANFVFVNSGVGRTGCIGLMNMLYGRNNLHCIHLFDGDTQETYLRQENGLQEVGGRTFGAGFILVRMAPDGSTQLLEAIEPDTYPDLPITWLSNAPLRPDESYILRPESSYADPSKAQRAGIKMLRLQPPSDLYQYFAGQLP